MQKLICVAAKEQDLHPEVLATIKWGNRCLSRIAKTSQGLFPLAKKLFGQFLSGLLKASSKYAEAANATTKNTSEAIKVFIK